MAEGDGSVDTGNPAEGTGDWTAGLDAEGKQFVEGKGWKDPGSVISSYRNLEKAMGHPAEHILVRPDFDNPEAASKFYDSIGRPAKPEEYVFQRPETVAVDEGLDQWFRGTAHKQGLTQRQAAGLDADWNEYTAQAMEAQTAQARETEKQDEAALRVDWGPAYDVKMKAARSALREFGGDNANEFLDKLEGSDVFGRTEIYRFLASVGEKLMEDTGGTEGEGSPGFGASPTDAKAKIEELNGNPEFVKKLFDPTLPGHKEAKAQIDRLHELAYG